MTTPLISVVTGIYNGSKDARETIASVLSQKDCEFELIVVDDGSTDGSAEMLASMSAADPRLRVLTQANAGLTRALVRGCESARGEFIARQDVGDISLPHRLARQAAALVASPSAGFAACAHRLVGPAREPLTSTESAPETPATGQTPHPHHGSVMFRKSTYLQAGSYRPEFYFAQDIDLWSRMIEHATFITSPEVLYEVRFDLDSITARHRPAQQALRSLIEQTKQARLRGESEAPILAQAAAIRPGGGNTARMDGDSHRSEAAYFVGSCLAKQGDPRARHYLVEAVRRNPLHFRSWYKLARMGWTAGRG
ncbi:MAG: glycosyltransferase [Ramlibacter sp.]|nr:glycosyltransferase [Ramlibacter sp.]